MNPGIYKNIPFEEYEKWGQVRKSWFKHILKSGLHFKHFLENGEKESDFMVFGNLVDTLLFEPLLFDTRYKVTPDTYDDGKGNTKPWNWNANICKDWRKNNLDKIIIKPEDHHRANDIVLKIMAHPEAGKWLSEATYQVSLSWVDPDTELACKSRIDALRANEMIIDLKITNNPHPSNFSRIINNFLYHVQGAFYHDGYILAQGGKLEDGPSIPFLIIAVEDQPPHDVVCYNLGPESFECGRIIYKTALDRYKEYKENDEYTGYSNIAEEIEIPMWARNKIQMDGIIE